MLARRDGTTDLLFEPVEFQFHLPDALSQDRRDTAEASIRAVPSKSPGLEGHVRE
jgi:hypothetical protein